MKHILFFLFCLAFAGCSGSAGPAGPAGAVGAQGPTGPAGQNGTTRIVASIFCSGQVSGNTGNAASLNGTKVEYWASLMSSGDVYANAVIAGNSFQIQGTSFYSYMQNGATTGSVTVIADAYGNATSGFWNVSLDRSSLVVTAVYTDAELGVQSPVTNTFTSSACQSSTY